MEKRDGEDRPKFVPEEWHPSEELALLKEIREDLRLIKELIYGRSRVLEGKGR